MGEDLVHCSFSLDEAFSFVFDNSPSEPVTPYRLAIYLLIRVMDKRHRQKPFDLEDHYQLSILLHSLLNAVNLSFPEMIEMIRWPLRQVAPDVFLQFLAKVDTHRGEKEILIRRDQLLHQPRKLDRLGQPFALQKSLIGLFVRKLAVTQARQSITQILRSHKHWLEWLDDARPSARSDLFGGYTIKAVKDSASVSGDDSAHLAPLIDDITHLRVTPIKDKATRMSEGFLVASISPASKKRKECERGDRVEKRRNLFKAFTLPPSATSYEVQQHPGAQPQLTELLSSSRARALITRQLHALHVSPDEAMEAKQLKAACEFIRKHYPDLPLVHLVIMMNAIRCHNMFEAGEALQQFFDWTAIRLNETNNMSHSITATDQRHLRYAPLLHARLARIFQYKNHALHFLSEAVHQAQTSHDLVCLRLAEVEQAAVDISEDLNSTTENDSTGESLSTEYIAAALLACMSIADGEVQESREGEDEDAKAEAADTRAFIKQLNDCATLQKCISWVRMAKDPKSLLKGLQRCAGADYGVDRESQTRLINEAARVIAATHKLANGFIDTAASDCNRLLYFNPGDQWCQRYDTEAHVIAGVNVVYAHAYNGQFDEARALIKKLKTRFSEKNNWQCAYHWKCCESLVEYDRAFFFGDWTAADRWLIVMAQLAPAEADLRKAIMVHSKGDVQEAINIARQNVEEVKNSTDLRLRLRCDIALAVLYASNNLEHVALSILEQCKAVAQKHSLDLFRAMILRRIAYIDAVEGRIKNALLNIEECEWILKTHSQPLENALLHMTIFTVHSHKNDTSADAVSVQLNALAAARREFRRASAPLLEKAVLASAAKLFNNCKRTEERDECATLLSEIDEKYPGQISWTVL